MKRRSLILVAATLLGVMPLIGCASEIPTALFLGDSYTAGVELPANEISDRWASRLSQQQGWVELNQGCAGAGYTHLSQVCMTTYRGQIDALVDAEPDVIVVSGAVNDLGSTLGEIEAAAQATFVSLQSAFPRARVYVIGGVYADAHVHTVGGPTLEEIDLVIAAQATAAGATYVDIGAPLKDRPDLLADDGLHPNSEGHAVIAELTSNAIGRTD